MNGDYSNVTMDNVALLIGLIGVTWFITYLIIVVMYIFLGITNDSW